MPTTPRATAWLRQLHRLWFDHWLTAAGVLLACAWALWQEHPWGVLVAAVVGLVLSAVTSWRIRRVYRTVLDPGVNVGVQDLADIRALVVFYTQAARGPEALRRWWLPPLSPSLMVARRATAPWWGPRGNLALSSRVSAARSTALMPFLVERLQEAHRDGDPGADDVAISAVALREAWSVDIVRQQQRDGQRQTEASAAWLLLNL